MSTTYVDTLGRLVEDLARAHRQELAFFRTTVERGHHGRELVVALDMLDTAMRRLALAQQLLDEARAEGT